MGRRRPSGPFVQNRAELFSLYNLATAYGRRPSEVIGIDDEWAAYQLDMAALVLGRKVEAALNENAGKKKKDRKPRQVVINEALGLPLTGKAGGFRAPPGPVKTVKLKPGESIVKAIDRATES